jgi:Zn-finger nucleic acid-binding protein
LIKKTIDGVDLFQCAHCHGVWIPKEDLLTLAASRNISPLTTQIEAEALPSHFRQGALLCPSDGARMLFTTINDIEIDLCPTCHGVWLDKGEMESLPAVHTSQAQSSHSLGYNALDVLLYLPPVDPDAIQAGVETVGNATGAVIEVAAEAASGAGDILGDLLSAIAEALFNG